MTVSPTSIEQYHTDSSYLLANLADETYLMPGYAVREIARWREPLPVPGAPPALPGIINQRGIILPVVDLRNLVGLGEIVPTRLTRYVIVSVDETDMALVVDSVTDIITLHESDMGPVPSALDPQRGRLLRAVTRLEDNPVSLLDLEAIINILRTGA